MHRSIVFQIKRQLQAIPLDQLIIKAYVIDISAKAKADYLLSVEDIISFEKTYGIIEKKSLVIVYTGWSRSWHHQKAYRNESKEGVMAFPSISAEAAQFLINRHIAGIAINTLSSRLPSKRVSSASNNAFK